MSSQIDQLLKIFLSKRIALSIFLELQTSNEIIAAIRLLSMNKAFGCYQIPSYFLRIAADVIAPYLQYNISLSFCLFKGISSESCTVAKVIVLYKKSDKTSLANYCPISILSCFSKILERLIYFRFTNFFSEHNVVYKAQYGFQKIFPQFMLFSI